LSGITGAKLVKLLEDDKYNGHLATLQNVDSVRQLQDVMSSGCHQTIGTITEK